MSKNKKIEERKKKVAAELNLFKKKGYTKQDISISASMANFFSLFVPLPIMAAIVILFGQLYGWNSFEEGYNTWISTPTGPIIFILALLASTVVHELIHGLFFGLTARSHFKVVEFGVLWKSLNPYCTCTEAISKPKYMLSLLAPGLILGLCISVFGVTTGSPSILVFGLFNISMAGGDMCIAIKILQFSKRGRKELYLDHPEKPGSIALVKSR
ncbi:DUF3267 domain-containing protein [Candidatus Saccharibacteria bacterium]|nr:DUF3267 domain-containing protein [Candidatus Saccharibacteria bacterium]